VLVLTVAALPTYVGLLGCGKRLIFPPLLAGMVCESFSNVRHWAAFPYSQKGPGKAMTKGTQQLLGRAAQAVFMLDDLREADARMAG
jgi:hypothetical protein